MNSLVPDPAERAPTLRERGLPLVPLGFQSRQFGLYSRAGSPWVPMRPRSAHECCEPSEGALRMSPASDWKVPASVRPKPQDYAYDLDQAQAAVVGVGSIIPGDAFSAGPLGPERAAHAVPI